MSSEIVVQKELAAEAAVVECYSAAVAAVVTEPFLTIQTKIFRNSKGTRFLNQLHYVVMHENEERLVKQVL